VLRGRVSEHRHARGVRGTTRKLSCGVASGRYFVVLARFVDVLTQRGLAAECSAKTSLGGEKTSAHPPRIFRDESTVSPIEIETENRGFFDAWLS